MTFQIGRVTADDVIAVDRNGKTFRVTAHVLGDLEPLIANIQLNGHVTSPDEPVIPVVDSSGQAPLNGFFRLLDVSYPTDPTTIASQRVPFTVTLEQVASSHMPLVELRTLGALRTNAHSILVGSTSPSVALPNDAGALDLGFNKGGVCDSDTGNVVILADSDLLDGRISYGLAASVWYEGAATLQLDPGVADPYSITGRQVEVVNSASAWVIHNGLVRLTSGATGNEFEIDAFDGTAWGNSKTFKLRGLAVGDVSIVGARVAMTVLRNSPNVVSIRVAHTGNLGTSYFTVTVDITLRRGMRMFDISVATSDGTTTKWGLANQDSEAASAITGGMAATAEDADNQKYVVAIAPACSVSSDGLYLDTAASSATFGLGITGSSTGSDTAFTTTSSLIAAWYASLSETQRVVDR